MKQLKSWPMAFGQIVGKVRKIDARVNLELTQGEEILYREFSPMTRMYSGREALITVGHVTRGNGEFDPLTGIHAHMVLFDIAGVSLRPSVRPSPELEDA